MSLEEDLLLGKVAKLEKRVNALEAIVTSPKSKAHEGGEQSSAGTSSETSTEKPPTTSGTSKPAPRKRARSTENRSSKGRAENSTAHSTGTAGQETGEGDG